MVETRKLETRRLQVQRGQPGQPIQYSRASAKRRWLRLRLWLWHSPTNTTTRCSHSATNRGCNNCRLVNCRHNLNNNQNSTQTIKVTVNGNAAAFNANTAQKESTCCGIGVLAGTMTQTDGVCAHKTGTNTQCAAADPVRRGAVIITVTYTVDSAVASITLTTVVDSASAMTLTTLTDAIAAVIAANPTWQGSVTAPTITEIQVATLTTPAATSSDSDNTGIIIGAVVGAIVGIAIIAGIAFFIVKKDSNPSPAQVEPFDNKVGVRAQ